MRAPPVLRRSVRHHRLRAADGRGLDGALEQRRMAAVARALAFRAQDRGQLLRATASAALAAALAGIAVGGIGGRLVMRVSGAMSDQTRVGIAITNNGNVLGDVTLGGTLGLVIFAGLLPGLIAGTAYALARPWLAPLGRWAGCAFGLALLSAIGPVVLEPFNIDFRKFGSALLNVAMFALLFPLFGATVAWLLPAVERRVMFASASSPWVVGALLALAALTFTLVLASGALVGALTGQNSAGDRRGFLLLYFLVVPALARVILGRERPFADARELPRATRLATYALLIAPVALGLPATFEAVTFLAR